MSKRLMRRERQALTREELLLGNSKGKGALVEKPFNLNVLFSSRKSFSLV